MEKKEYSKIDYFCTDFDRVLTFEETTKRLVRKTRDSYPLDKIGWFDEVWNKLNSDYKKAIQAIYSDFLNSEHTDMVKALTSLSATIHELEITSSNKAAELFDYVERDALFREGKRVSLINHARDVIGKCNDSGIPVYVVSMNWSKDIVSGCLDGVIHERSIYSNDVVFEDNIAARKLDLPVCSQQDKLRIMKEVTSNSARVAYVGDGPIDIWCLLEARYGFIINPQDYVFETLWNLGVKEHELNNSDNEPGLFLVNSWKEIDEILSD